MRVQPPSPLLLTFSWPSTCPQTMAVGSTNVFPPSICPSKVSAGVVFLCTLDSNPGQQAVLALAPWTASGAAAQARLCSGAHAALTECL